MTGRRRDPLITLARVSITKNEHDEEVEGFAPVGTEWANVIYGKGSERRQAAMEQASQPATFYVDDNALTRSITTADRIELDGQWDIEGNVPSLNRVEREITAVRNAK